MKYTKINIKQDMPFTLFNFKALELKNKYQELEQLMRVCNNGVTVVEL